jgi:hypothetical protein
MAHTDPHGGHHGGPINHETTDANLTGVEKLIAVVVVFLATTAVAMWLVFNFFYAREASQDVKPPAVANRQGDRLPPLPRLQTTPYADLAKFRQAESAAVTSYAWVDKANGLVQVPVARAMELIAEKGLPAFAPAVAPAVETGPAGAKAGATAGPEAGQGASGGEATTGHGAAAPPQ